MKNSIYYLILFLCTIIILSGCYYDNEEELYPNSFNCNVDDTNFELVIKPIIDANCAISGCHVAGTGRKNLSVYQGLKDVVDDGRLNDRVIVNKSMPPSGPLSKCDIATIDAWIKQGGPSQ